jgi:peroxiredoxin
MKCKNALTVLTAVLIAGTAFGAYQVGDSIDDFTLFDADGNSVSLYGFHGKVIFINFWANW